MDEHKDDEKKDVIDENPSGKKDESTQKPENDGRKDKKKTNVYDQYRYWGSDSGRDGDGKMKMNGRNRITLFIFLALIVSFAFLFFSQGSGQRYRNRYFRERGLFGMYHDIPSFRISDKFDMVRVGQLAGLQYAAERSWIR